MAHLLETARRTVAARGLVTRGDHVIVACSGGPDSIAMTHALARLRHELGLTLSVASVDHGLRPGAAEEVLFVGSFARELGLPFFPISLTVCAPAVSGLPAAARRARYEALLALMRDRGACALAVGHTRDDQAETVLARLLRGAGIAGLAGIDPRRPDGVIRPLIDCSREDVLRYVEAHGLRVVDDPTNTDLRFERARIRHDLLPRLEVEDPKLREHLARLADEARCVEGYLGAEAEAWLGDRRGRALPIADLRGLSAPLRTSVVRRWIEAETGRRPGRAHFEAIEGLISASGEVLLADGFDVVREGEAIVLRHRSKRRGRGERRTERERRSPPKKVRPPAGSRNEAPPSRTRRG